MNPFRSPRFGGNCGDEAALAAAAVVVLAEGDAVFKSAHYTEATPIVGCFTSVALTSQIQPTFRTPPLVTDPLTSTARREGFVRQYQFTTLYRSGLLIGEVLHLPTTIENLFFYRNLKEQEKGQAALLKAAPTDKEMWINEPNPDNEDS